VIFDGVSRERGGAERVGEVRERGDRLFFVVSLDGLRGPTGLFKLAANSEGEKKREEGRAARDSAFSRLASHGSFSRSRERKGGSEFSLCNSIKDGLRDNRRGLQFTICLKCRGRYQKRKSGGARKKDMSAVRNLHLRRRLLQPQPPTSIQRLSQRAKSRRKRKKKEGKREGRIGKGTCSRYNVPLVVRSSFGESSLLGSARWGEGRGEGGEDKKKSRSRSP